MDMMPTKRFSFERVASISRALVQLLRRTSMRVTGSLAISAALLVLALGPIDIDELSRLLGSASLKWIALALGFYWLELLLRVQRWSIILRPVRRLPFSHVATSLLVGYAANNVLPARLGELFRADFVRRRHGISRLSTVGTIVIERLLDMAAVVACAALGMLYMFHDQVVFDSSLLKAMLMGGLIVALTCVFVFLMSAHSWRWLPQRFPRLRQAIGAITEGFRSVKSSSGVAELTMLTSIVWLCNGCAMWAILNAVGMSPHGAIVLLLIGMAGLAAAIPSAPANLGTLQFAFVTVLSAGSYAATASFAAAVLVQLVLLGSVTLAGSAIYAAWSLRPGLKGTHAVTQR